MKVLWLSRHPLGADQLADLTRELGDDVTHITHVNVTFSVHTAYAVDQLIEASKGFDVVAGVFPATLAAALARFSASAPEDSFVAFTGLYRKGEKPLHCLAAVAAPAAAIDGETRQFVHHHWEYLTK